jgi:rSAM/selenodomain-associated transferase 2
MLAAAMSHPAPVVSVVVPSLGDAALVARLAEDFSPSPRAEYIVSRTGPADPAEAALRAARPDLRWVDGPPGRGVQLNAGAAVAAGQWLWFVHADCRLPAGWIDVFDALGQAQPPVVGGSFAFRLDSAAWQARVIERGVAWRVRWLGLPYGDQGLFVRRDAFTRMHGFAPWPLMEDVEFVRRLTRHGRLVHLSQQVTSSARRWERDGWWRRSGANLVTLSGYFLGIRPERLARRYDRGTVDPRGSSSC